MGATRGDLLAAINILYHSTTIGFWSQDLQLINSFQRRVAVQSQLGLLLHIRNPSRLLIVVSSEACLPRNFDGTSQLGYIVMLAYFTWRNSVIRLPQDQAGGINSTWPNNVGLRGGC